MLGVPLARYVNTTTQLNRIYSWFFLGRTLKPYAIFAVQPKIKYEFNTDDLMAQIRWLNEEKKSEIQEPAVATYVTITNIYTLNTLNSHLDVNIGNDGLIYFGRVQISSNKQSSEKVKVKRGNGIAANS